MGKQFYGSLANSGGALESLPTFFDKAVEYLKVKILGNSHPNLGVSNSLKTVISPLKGFPKLLKAKYQVPQAGNLDPFNFGQAVQGEDSKIHFHAPDFTKIDVDMQAKSMFNSSCEPDKNKSHDALTSWDLGAHLPTVNQLRSANNMLSHVCEYATVSLREKISPRLTLLTPHSSAVGFPCMAAHGEDFSFEPFEECCDQCDSRATETEVSFTGDEEHIQFLCGPCWLMGFSPEAGEVAA